MTERWLADDRPSARFPLYTRGNIGEVFPEVVSPLTWGILGREAEIGWRRAWRRFGTNLPRDFEGEPMGILGCFGGYGYLNASYGRVFAVRTPGLTIADLDRQFFGKSEAPPYVARRGDRSAVASARVARTLVSTLLARALPELEHDKGRVNDWLSVLPDPGTADDADLLGVADGFRPLFRDLFEHHILMTFQASVGRGFLARICEQTLDDPSLTNRLLVGIGEVDSAQPAQGLWELSRIEVGQPEWETGLIRFLARHGSRGPNEWEGSSPTWSTDPELVLGAVDRIRLADDEQEPRRQLERLGGEREEARQAARSRLSPPARLPFDLALRSATLFTQGRERSKTTIVRLLHGLRLTHRELARRGRDRGGPSDLADLWLLAEDELPAYLRDPEGFAEPLASRRAHRERLRARVPPFVFDGVQPDPSTWARRQQGRSVPKVGPLVGIAGSPGTWRGPARIVLDPCAAGGLQPGDVLVVPIADAAWTPLFMPAGAIVVEVGAELSHAVIVARELGIPAVVSVAGATTAIGDGDIVEVDGDTGHVRLPQA
jgi:pyruvate,water dikinase